MNGVLFLTQRLLTGLKLKSYYFVLAGVDGDAAARTPQAPGTPQSQIPPSPHSTHLQQQNAPLGQPPPPGPGAGLHGQPAPSPNSMLPPGMGPQQPPPQQQTCMESHFMQQQSQIFVFSTDLANKAAECVLRGQVKSVIEYHIDQPSTKKFLQVISYFFFSLPHLSILVDLRLF